MARKPRTPGLHKRTQNNSPAKDKLWQSMRIMRSNFTSADLATVSEVNAANARLYVRALRRAGFLRRTSPRTPGKPGSADLYALVRNTGPLSPIRHRHGGVYDRNTGIRWGDDGKPVATTPSDTEGDSE
jgi:hypothetical protein